MTSTTAMLNQIIQDAAEQNVTHLYTQDEELKGKHVTIQGKKLLNFGSCSYMGLETHPALKQGVVDAVMRYGTQFSSSRTYLSLGLYGELESKLQDIFQKPVLVSASTTLGHLAAMPVIVGNNDAVVLDLQVHSSIQMTVQMLKARKIPVYVIPHNCMDSLEKKIRDLNNKYERIWYFADGVYSMYGDYAPFGQLEDLLNKYRKFHLYIDDAHGMSWTGDRGMGVVRSHMAHHEKMVLAVSLNKTFAAAGGCIVFPTEQMARSVRNCGSTYIFCGPIQPPMLGAAIASVNLHLSPEFKQQQQALKDLIAYTNERLNELSMPQYMETESPVFFIPAGLPKITKMVVARMKQKGYYLNSAGFPATPMKKSGIRFMITTHMNEQAIDAMLSTLQQVYVTTLLEEGSSCEKVAKDFNIPAFEIAIEGEAGHKKKAPSQLKAELQRSITQIDAHNWNGLFHGQGNLAWENIKMLEETFSRQALPEHNWDFYYYKVKDGRGHTVLQTFYTAALVKDDMFSPGYVSKKVEATRAYEPYYLSSKNIVTGSLITKGRHVYIDREHPNWKEALKMLVEQMQETLREQEASKIMLRDFTDQQDKEFETLMLELGLTSYRLLNNCVIEDLSWDSRETYLKGLGQKYRYNVKKEILQYEHLFEVETGRPCGEEDTQRCYDLYQAVFEGAYDLNVFPLPYDYFEAMCQDEQYDIVRLYLKPEHNEQSEERVLVGVMFSYINQSVYNALIVGLDYDYVRSHNTYKQIMYQTMLRAKALGCQTLDLAYTAELEKKKLGARLQEVYAYVQATEHYSHSILEAMS